MKLINEMIKKGVEVVDYNDWDEDREVVVIDGVDYDCIGKSCKDVEELIEKYGFENVVMYRRYGVISSGLIKLNDKLISLDFVDGWGWELKKV